MLWLSLHFDRLALDLLARGQTQKVNSPLAISCLQTRQLVIHACNEPARAAGIVNGMPITAAQSLCNTLRVHARDTRAEHIALSHVANWALRFTSSVSLKSPDGLLLEIEGSLRLFGNAEAIRQYILDGLHEQGYHARLAIAPTPLGSWLLCRSANAAVITQLPALAAALRKLPLATLELEDNTHRTLHGLGLHTVGDCLRLPRTGLNKRVSTALMDYLDRALGRSADPQAAYVPPARFQSQLLLPSEVHSSDALLFALRRLLVELTAYLHARGCGIQSLSIKLLHTDHHRSEIKLALVEASRDTEHLCNLLRVRLEQHQLPAPVEAIELHADRLVELAQQNDDLFATPESVQQNWHHLLEQLRARLQADTLQELYPAADHRPEYAWQARPGNCSVQDTARHRPAWLLEQPLALQLHNGAPWLDSELHLLHGPERIESGWWDGRDVRRDYYIAENTQHQRVWIYRELHKPFGWFLHGVFG